MGKAYTLQKKSFAATVIEDAVSHKKVWRITAPLWLQNHLNKFKVGDQITLTITNEKPKRTENQNRYYWMYLGMIAEQTGNDIDDLHTLFKGLFLGKEIVEVFGHKVRRAGSTTELSAGQFSDYIRRIEEKTGILAPPTEGYLRTGEDEGGKLPEYPESTGQPTF